MFAKAGISSSSGEGMLLSLVLGSIPSALLPVPGRYAYIEFEQKSSVKAAVELDESIFRGRVIKVRAGQSPGAHLSLPALWHRAAAEPPLPSRCCPRGPTCRASAALTVAAAGATSKPGEG